MIITAKFAAICPCCSASISIGSKVEWSRGAKAVHVACAGKAVAASAPARSIRRGPPLGYRRERMGSGHGHAAVVAGYSSYCTANGSCRCYDCAS